MLHNNPQMQMYALNDNILLMTILNMYFLSLHNYYGYHLTDLQVLKDEDERANYDYMLDNPGNK